MENTVHNGIMKPATTHDSEDEKDPEEIRLNRLRVLEHQSIRCQSKLQYARNRLRIAENNLRNVTLRKESIQAKLLASYKEEYKLKLQHIEIEHQLRIEELDKAIDILDRYKEELYAINKEKKLLLSKDHKPDEQGLKKSFDLVLDQISKKSLELY